MKFKKILVTLLLLCSLSISSQSTETTSNSSTVSISICDSDSKYAFEAIFSSKYVKKIREIIEKYFDKSYINSKTEKWEQEDIYTFHLKPSGKLTLLLNKENTSNF